MPLSLEADDADVPRRTAGELLGEPEVELLGEVLGVVLDVAVADGVAVDVAVADGVAVDVDVADGVAVDVDVADAV